MTIVLSVCLEIRVKIRVYFLLQINVLRFIVLYFVYYVLFRQLTSWSEFSMQHLLFLS